MFIIFSLRKTIKQLKKHRTGENNKQASVPLQRRGCLTGPAYKAVRYLTPKDFITPKLTTGIDQFFLTLEEGIEPEKPVKSNELIEKAFYEATVWRRAGESMQMYSLRRREEFEALTDHKDLIL